jgi:hypothetical protein
VLHLMADSPQGDQVLFCIVAEIAAPYEMMCLQVRGRTAILTPPAISFEHSAAKYVVAFNVEF